MHTDHLTPPAARVVKLLGTEPLLTVKARVFRSLSNGVTFEAGPAGIVTHVNVRETAPDTFSLDRASLRRGMQRERYTVENVPAAELPEALVRVATLHP